MFKKRAHTIGTNPMGVRKTTGRLSGEYSQAENPKSQMLQNIQVSSTYMKPHAENSKPDGVVLTDFVSRTNLLKLLHRITVRLCVRCM
jgi:hypothetical protein